MTTLLNPTLARGLTGQAHFNALFRIREAEAAGCSHSNRGINAYVRGLEQRFRQCVPKDHIIYADTQGKGKSRSFLGIFLLPPDDGHGFHIGFFCNRRFKLGSGPLPIQITDHFIQRAFERLATTEIREVSALLAPVYLWFLERGRAYPDEKHAVDVDGKLDIVGLGTVYMKWVASEQQYVLKTFLHESQLKH